MASTAVISAIGGYDAATILPFVDSVLRRCGADLHLLDLPRSPRPAWHRWLANQPRVHLHVCRDAMPPEALSVFRFPLSLQLLRSIRADQLLLCDSRDALLQSDPFPALPAGSASSFLWLAQEDISLAECDINLGWLKQHGSPQDVAAIEHQPVLCAGTILGSADFLRTALTTLADHLQPRLKDRNSVPWGLDQAMINLLAWQDKLGVPFEARGNTDGFALTLHHGHRLTLDRQGRLLLGNGHVAPIVHQYDRFPWLAEHLLRELSGHTFGWSRPG